MQRTAIARPPSGSTRVRVLASLGLNAVPLMPAGIVTVALGLPTLLFPFGPDQAIFAYIAHRISMGGFPYVTAWDQKPPAIYLLYLAGIHVPGPLMRNVRIFDLFMVCLTLVAVYLLGRRLWGRWAGGFAAVLYGTAYTTEYGYWHTAQPDGYTALPLCFALWLYYRSLTRGRAWPYLLAGLLTGFAFQLRFFSALIGLALLYIEWNQARCHGRAAWAAAARRIAWFSLGFLCTQAIFAAYLAAGHALGAYLFTEFRFASAYARLGGPYSPEGFRWNLFLDAARAETLSFLYSHLFVSLPAAIALALGFGGRGDARTREIGLATLCAYLGVLIQAKFFLYHWLAVLPFLSLLGGRGLACLSQALLARLRWQTAIPAVAAVVALLVVLSPPVTDNALHQWRGVAQYYSGPVSRSAFNNQFGPYAQGTFSYLADDEVGRYLRAHTEPDDTVYVYGYEPLVYLISGRESASRFIYVFPIISTWSPPAWKDEFYRELDENRPRYILIQANEGAPWITGLHEDTAHYAAHDARLQALLAARYEPETTIEDFSLYRLRG